MEYDAVLKRVLQTGKPGKAERARLLSRVNHALRQLQESIDSSGLKARAMLGGSLSKDTWLSGSSDADIFVRFDYKGFSDRSDGLSDALAPCLEFLRPVRIHGSRDYFQARLRGITLEIVPILNIDRPEEARNITDISPLHVSWVKAQSSEAITDEIRLAKAFCKAQRCYGAESYIMGFSGYVLEVMVIHFGSFLKLLRASLAWNLNKKTLIDVASKAPKRLNTSKTEGPIIVIDPVQPERNAAAALSMEKTRCFVSAAHSFLDKPSVSFFKLELPSLASMKKKSLGRKLIVVYLTMPEGKEDIIGARIVKVMDFIKKGLISNGFKIICSDWGWDKQRRAEIYFILDPEPLSEWVRLSGPPLKAGMHVKKFKEKHDSCELVEDKSRIVAIGKRRFRLPERLISSLLEDDYITSRAEKAALKSYKP